MAIEFQREVQTASFYSPLEDFEAVEVDVEVREDPLTGRSARIVPGSFVRPDGEPDIAEVVEDDEGCFFCPDMVGDVTPEYPDWVGMERGRVGEATSFPNLNPYGPYSNVVALTDEHWKPLDAFSAAEFENGLAAALEYVDAVFDHDDDAAYASVNMNFLRAAGSSIIHPHLQTLVDDRGTNEDALRADAARAYREETGDVYWADLVEAERDGDRYAGSTGSVDWLAPFAPKHHYQVTGVVDPEAVGGGAVDGVPAPDDDAVSDLADGITNVLAYYADEGLNSFNFALRLVADEPACPPVVDVVGRSVFDRYYWSDSPFFVTLHDEGVVDVAPEDVAGAARGHF
ncbi:MAG TPA: hypothetical protein VKA37_13995 [Halobacteriales archaeon]|nr:hypothetical protein [Halobacteriales archaeon]